MVTALYEDLAYAARSWLVPAPANVLASGATPPSRDAASPITLITGAALFFLTAMAALASLWPYVVENHPRDIAADFSFFWAAGKTWVNGGSPYSALYQEIYTNSGAITHHDNPPPYYYPPNSIVLTYGLGLFSLKQASSVWALLNFFLFSLTAWSFGGLMRTVSASKNGTAAPSEAAQRRLQLFFTACYIAICAGVWKATAVIFLHNTPAFLFYAGVIACLWGVASGRNSLLVVGLFFCMMKPQIGAPLFLAAFLAPQTRRASLAALAATVGAAILGAGPNYLETLANMMGSISEYGIYPENAAANVSGLGHLIYRLVGIDVSAFIMLFVSIVTTTAFGFTAPTALRGRQDWPMILMIFGLTVTLFLTPSHNNYYLALAPVFLLLPSNRLGKIAITAAALMTMTAWDVAAFFENAHIGYLQANAALIDSVALLIVTGVMVQSYLFLTNPKNVRSANVESYA